MAWWDNLNPGNAPIWKGKNPFNAGQDLPWGEGPQDPYKAQYKAFNPGEYQGLDTSSLGAALRQDIGKASARAKGRLQGALQRGGGGGADAISGLAQLEGEQGQQENILNAKLAQQDYDNRFRQYLAAMEMEQRKELQDQSRYMREKAPRDAASGFAGQVVGTGLGALTGGVGAGLGASLSKKWFD